VQDKRNQKYRSILSIRRGVCLREVNILGLVQTNKKPQEVSPFGQIFCGFEIHKEIAIRCSGKA
jgi:hypothetical protein